MKYAVYQVYYLFENVDRKELECVFDNLDEAEGYAQEKSRIYEHDKFEVVDLPCVDDLSEDGQWWN